jgi:hypothetical protein
LEINSILHGMLAVRVTAVCTFEVAVLLKILNLYNYKYFIHAMTDRTGQRVDFEIELEMWKG